MLKGKIVVLGITGGIAAYKAADLASKLTQAGAKVETIMTESALKFITPVTLRGVTGRNVATTMWDLSASYSVEHVALADMADVVVIAPATANTIAKIANGLADDLLSCTVLATKAPVVVAPAMHNNMWENPVTQENIKKLKTRGFTVVGPGYGHLASGAVGWGRLIENEVIIAAITTALGKNGDLAGRCIVVTVGGTSEPIDPVRILTNRSSGKMGFAVAEAARDRGAKVKVIIGSVSAPIPSGVEVVKVETAIQMRDAVVKATALCDALIMTAAVADYMPKKPAKQKIKKETRGNMVIDLIKTPDILTEVRDGDFVKVGFAAESEHLLENAKDKLIRKRLDLVVANDITRSDSGFGTDTNKVWFVNPGDKTDDLPLMTKREVGDKLLDRVVELFKSKEKKDNEPVSFEIKLKKGYIERNYLPVPQKYRELFPEYKASFVIETNSGEITTKAGLLKNGDYSSLEIRKGMTKWYRKNAALAPGSVVKFIIEPLKKYNLEIVK
jgi:phosphopantothenoylcysteine decarboxylase/phosphopantothenate--cysteine ligase